MYENDRAVLRKLAYEYLEISKKPQIEENLKLHQAVNDLHMIRPVVLMDEFPWHELGGSGELDLLCESPILRNTELFMRRVVYQYRHCPVDMMVRPYIPVFKRIGETDFGVTVKEDILEIDAGNNIVAHEYHDQLATWEDLDKLHLPTVIYDKTGTMEEFNLLGELIGDIIPVKLQGLEWGQINTWDEIARYRGVTPLLIDLAERPDFTHALMRKMTDIFTSRMEQYEALGLFDCNPYALHCTCGRVADLPGEDFDGEHAKMKNVWGRGTAQIFASVSKAMHDEFDIQYTNEILSRFGLSYYGCCEPLDKKIDILEQIPNLRKISITPWADVNVAAEAIGEKYVMAVKPNPASVGVLNLDKDALKKEIKTILDAAKRNGCSLDLVLKDVSTCHKNPQNLFDWAEIVSGMVKNY